MGSWPISAKPTGVFREMDDQKTLLVTFETVPAEADLQAILVNLGIAASRECSQHPETAADPQETADAGRGIDIPHCVETRDLHIARGFERLEGPGIPDASEILDTISGSAKTSMSEPVPPRAFEGETAPSHNGTVERYLIWSNEHRAWWRPNSAGYTVYATAAGIYSKEEALSTSWKGRDGWRSEQQCPAEIAVPLSSIPEHYRPTE